MALSVRTGTPSSNRQSEAVTAPSTRSEGRATSLSLPPLETFREELVSTVDLLPTLLAAAGAQTWDLVQLIDAQKRIRWMIGRVP